MGQHPAEIAFADSHRRLIQAAADAFMKEGYRASMDRIAERAGVARQTVYNHFPSKKDLFSEVAHIAAEDILISLDGDGGDLRVRRDDPLFAAETLMGMLCGFEHTRRLLCAPGRASDAERTRVVEIVDCFLRAFAPEL